MLNALAAPYFCFHLSCVAADADGCTAARSGSAFSGGGGGGGCAGGGSGAATKGASQVLLLATCTELCLHCELARGKMPASACTVLALPNPHPPPSLAPSVPTKKTQRHAYSSRAYTRVAFGVVNFRSPPFKTARTDLLM